MFLLYIKHIEEFFFSCSFFIDLKAQEVLPDQIWSCFYWLIDLGINEYGGNFLVFHCLLKCRSYCIMFKYCDNILLTRGLGWGAVGDRTGQPMRGMSYFFLYNLKLDLCLRLFSSWSKYIWIPHIYLNNFCSVCKV